MFLHSVNAVGLPQEDEEDKDTEEQGRGFLVLLMPHVAGRNHKPPPSLSLTTVLTKKRVAV